MSETPARGIRNYSEETKISSFMNISTAIKTDTGCTIYQPASDKFSSSFIIIH